MDRKQQIYEHLRSLTQNIFQENNFNFDSCNAHIISLDLGIDRSNVSRILNQLFQENRTIKIQGRPTTFLASDIVNNHIQNPYEKKEFTNANEFLSLIEEQNQTIGQILEQKIVGCQSKQSLYLNYQTIAPALLNPPHNQKVIFNLFGPYGSGKKFLITTLYHYAKSVNHLFKNDSLAIISAHQTYIFHEHHRVVIIDLFSEENISNSDIDSLITQIYTHNSIHNKPLPILFILSPTPFHSASHHIIELNFISFKEKSLREKVELILFEIHSQAKLVNKNILVERQYIESLATLEFEQENIIGLTRQIYFDISNLLFNSQKVTDRLILKKSSDINVPNLPENNIALPENILIKSNSRFSTVKNNLLLPQQSDILYTTYKKQNHYIEDVLLSYQPNLNLYYQSPLITQLKTTILSKDPMLMIFFDQIASDFCKDRTSLLTYRIKDTLPIDQQGKSIFRIIHNHLKTEISHLKLLQYESYTLEQIIAHAINIIRKTHVPIFIICHENYIATNYARTFNMLSKKRKFFALEYSQVEQGNGIELFTENIERFTNAMNKGNGIYLITDYPPLTTISSIVSRNTKITIFTSSPINYNVLFIIAKTNEKDAAKLAREIAMQKHISRNHTSINKKELFNQINQPFSKLFPSIRINYTNQYFYHLLEAITKKLNIPSNEYMIHDFIFQGNAILLNRQNRFIYPKPNLIDDAFNDLFTETISSNNQLDQYHFTLEEICTLYYAIFNNIQYSYQRHSNV